MIAVNFVTGEEARKMKSLRDLTDEERAEFRRMKDPVEADLRAFLRVKAREARARNRVVSVTHSHSWGAWAVGAMGVERVGIDAEVWEHAERAWAVLAGRESGISQEESLRCWVLGEAAFKAGAGEKWYPAYGKRLGKISREIAKQELIADGWRVKELVCKEGVAAVVWKEEICENS